MNNKYLLLNWFKNKFPIYKLIDEQNNELLTEETLIRIEDDYFNDIDSDSYKVFKNDIISFFEINLLNNKNSSITMILKEENK